MLLSPLIVGFMVSFNCVPTAMFPQVVPNVPPSVANVVNRGSELLSNLTAGTPWEAVAKEVGSTLGANSGSLRAQITEEVDMLAEVITTWMASNSGPRLLRP